MRGSSVVSERCDKKKVGEKKENIIIFSVETNKPRYEYPPWKWFDENYYYDKDFFF